MLLHRASCSAPRLFKPVDVLSPEGLSRGRFATGRSGLRPRAEALGPPPGAEKEAATGLLGSARLRPGAGVRLGRAGRERPAALRPGGAQRLPGALRGAAQWATRRAEAPPRRSHRSAKRHVRLPSACPAAAARALRQQRGGTAAHTAADAKALRHLGGALRGLWHRGSERAPLCRGRHRAFDPRYPKGFLWFGLRITPWAWP